MIWSEKWTKESERIVAQTELEDVESILKGDTEKMIDSCIHIHHQVASQFDVSPQVFVNFIESYCHMLKLINSRSGGQVGHLKAGLQKLQGAKATVDKLSTDANEKKKLLSVKQAEANQAMQRI